MLNIFGKASQAKNCINCGESKTVIVNTNEELFSRFPKLWSWLNKTLLREVIVDNQDEGFQQNPQKDTLDVNQFMRIPDS